MGLVEEPPRQLAHPQQPGAGQDGARSTSWPCPTLTHVARPSLTARTTFESCVCLHSWYQVISGSLLCHCTQSRPPGAGLSLEHTQEALQHSPALGHRLGEVAAVSRHRPALCNVVYVCLGLLRLAETHIFKPRKWWSG